MKILRYVLGAVLLVSAPPHRAEAQSQPPSAAAGDAANRGSIATATKLLVLTRVEQTLELSFRSILPAFAQAVIGSAGASEEGKALIARITAQPNGRARLEQLLRDEFQASLRRRYPVLMRKMAERYAEAFNEAELQQLIAFYSSGVGAKWLILLPQLQQSLSKDSEAVGREAGAEAGARAFDQAEDEFVPPSVGPKT